MLHLNKWLRSGGRKFRQTPNWVFHFLAASWILPFVDVDANPVYESRSDHNALNLDCKPNEKHEPLDHKHPRDEERTRVLAKACESAASGLRLIPDSCGRNLKRHALTRLSKPGCTVLHSSHSEYFCVTALPRLALARKVEVNDAALLVLHDAWSAAKPKNT